MSKDRKRTGGDEMSKLTPEDEAILDAAQEKLQEAFEKSADFVMKTVEGRLMVPTVNSCAEACIDALVQHSPAWAIMLQTPMYNDLKIMLFKSFMTGWFMNNDEEPWTKPDEVHKSRENPERN
jgi:hypothetical protein